MSFYDGLLERFFGRTRVGAFVIVRIGTHVDRLILRWSHGRISSGFGSRFNRNAVLLVATGAQTGRERTVPLLATPVGDLLVLIASKGGDPHHPSWYRNLKKNPRCRLLSAAGEVEYIAREAEGEERNALWAAAVANYSGYADYQARVERAIPVMVLERTAIARS